jgi:glycosyltransferase involved in cell wall biosynthesis
MPPPSQPGSRKVLIVAYHYPPVGLSSGIQRTLKFSAYLRLHGWEPIVLTVDPRAYPEVNYGQMGDIPTGLQVERVFARDSARHFAIGGRHLRLTAIPDRWVSWWPAAVWRGMRLIRQHRPALIMSTFPIATAHLIALTLRRLSGLPWVADFRDNMTDPEYPRDPLTWRFNRWLEGATVRRCSSAVFTTPGALAMYADRYPDVPPARWSIIENGFDEENFASAEEGFDPKPLGAPDQQVLLHSGILYPEERDPQPFFAALAALKRSGEATSANLSVVLRATGCDEHHAALVQRYGIEDLIRLAPPIAYRDALREMLCADGLLLFQAAMCNHQIPAKLYEYLRAGRPILALTDAAGDTATTLRAAGVGTLANLADETDIRRQLSRFLAGLRSGLSQATPRSAAAAHSRRARTAELAALFERTLAAPA